ncbi:hypothetical protein HY440_02870 [Candidatus Microgenomates bacterium]|nr:hypothetical protein [Candidatus Microgenomates bacterium]
MFLPDSPIVFIALAPVVLLALIGAFWQLRRHEKELEKQKKEINQRIYETLILREIGERIGYELNIGKILDTIISSLKNLLPYTVSGYMLITPDGSSIDFRLHLEETVSQKFLDVVRDHLLDTLNQVAPKRFLASDLRQTFSGTIVDEAINDIAASIWIMPLTINSRGLGAMAIASKQAGLYHGPEMEILVKILAQASRAVNNLEKIVASEQERLNAMVASMADGVLMLGKSLELLVINPAALTLLGLPAKAKTTIFDVAASLADKIDLRAKIEESTTTDKLVVVDNIAVGHKMTALLISPVKDQNKAHVGTVVLFHDVTAQKELERVRGDFTAMMVHELRAPLTVVRGTADMFAKNPKLGETPDGQALLTTMGNSVTSMLSLVNDLLDVAKIEAGKFEIIKVKNNLGEILSDRVTFFRQLAATRSLTITAEVPNAGLTGQFDRDRIAQVLNNLISNAIKFTPVGGKITISGYDIKSEADIRWRFKTTHALKVAALPAIVVAVSDTGRGIGEDRIPNLFSKFSQLRSLDGEKGTGLGLVIVKGIVESHGGQVFVESRVDEGSTFYFTIPLDN